MVRSFNDLNYGKKAFLTSSEATSPARVEVEYNNLLKGEIGAVTTSSKFNIYT